MPAQYAIDTTFGVISVRYPVAALGRLNAEHFRPGQSNRTGSFRDG
jgi:hypothetical protein